jgi:hypothetical protein
MAMEAEMTTTEAETTAMVAGAIATGAETTAIEAGTMATVASRTTVTICLTTMKATMVSCRIKVGDVQCSVLRSRFSVCM